MSFTDEYLFLEDKHSVFKSINYEKVMKLFDKFKTGILFIGGTWCQNCQAIIQLLNSTAKKNKIRTVYHFDPRFINVFDEETDLRDCQDLETKLNYYYLIEKIGFTSDNYVQDTFIPRMNVPTIIGIKNGSCVGIISEEYILDENGLHAEDNLDDQSQYLENILTLLFQKVKEKR